MFRICSWINNVHGYAFYRNPGHDGSLYDGLLDSMARVNQLMIRQSLSLLVMQMLITLSGCSQSLLLIDMGVMLLTFIMSGCEQLVRGPTHIAGNGLDLVVTDVPDSRCGRWYSTRHLRSQLCQLCASC